MKRSLVAIFLGAAFSIVFFVFLFLLDMKHHFTPAGSFALAGPEKAMEIIESAGDAFYFVYFPLTAFFVGIVVSLVARNKPWLCSALAMLPIVLLLYTIELSADASLLSILKDSYLALSYLVLAGLVSVVTQKLRK